MFVNIDYLIIQYSMYINGVSVLINLFNKIRTLSSTNTLEDYIKNKTSKNLYDIFFHYQEMIRDEHEPIIQPDS